MIHKISSTPYSVKTRPFFGIILDSTALDPLQDIS